MRNITYDETPDVKFEEAWFSDVLEPHKSEIAEIREAYKLLLAIVELFKQTLPAIDSQLNTYYIDLFALVVKNTKKIEDDIYDRYDVNASQGGNLPSDFIHTDIYSGFYKPFLNLYSGKAEILKDKSDWEEIQKEMSDYYSQVNEVYHKYSLEGVKQTPHQELINEVSDYLKSKGQSLETVIKIDAKQYALRLSLRSNRLYVTGTALDNKEITLQKMRKGASTLLLELTIKACANKPTEFKSMTHDILASKSRFSDEELAKAIKKIGRFKQYISNIGLKGMLKGCFYSNGNSGLGYKFRTAFPQSEWDRLEADQQKAILDKLVNTVQKKA